MPIEAVFENIAERIVSEMDRAQNSIYIAAKLKDGKIWIAQSSTTAWGYGFDYDKRLLRQGIDFKEWGVSCRCIRD